MNIDPNIVDLINAEIDGELATADRDRLTRYLAGNAEARAYRDELAALCGELSTVEKLDPPEHLRPLILDNLKPRGETVSRRSRGNFFTAIFDFPIVRYATCFAAGVILSYALISSDQISKGAFSDVTNLVGTMTQPEPLGQVSMVDGMRLTLREVAGTVTLNQTGSMLIIDFDLSSPNPVEIVAGFSDPDVWFNGFAQLESQGTSISAGTGQVTLSMLGQGRYAVYLYNSSASAATVDLQFFSGGTLIHEAALEYREGNEQ